MIGQNETGAKPNAESKPAEKLIETPWLKPARRHASAMQ